MQKNISAGSAIASLCNRVIGGVAVTAISGYQRFISPHKGFSCAHRVLYGCESCSQYFKRVIAEEGLMIAIGNAQGRFQECREANNILKARRERCRNRQAYVAKRIQRHAIVTMSNTASSSDAPDEENIPANPEENQQDQKPKIGGSQWSKKRRSAPQNDAQNNSNYCDALDCLDCANCADGLDLLPNNCGDHSDCQQPFEAIECPDLGCADLNCGDANCLSGLDCSGLDCSGLDCGGLDCGGCG
jgi:putative component of membrane protein insertase Oxa1/YidC/SpoIIIJ protein YidD